MSESLGENKKRILFPNLLLEIGIFFTERRWAFQAFGHYELHRKLQFRFNYVDKVAECPRRM